MNGIMKINQDLIERQVYNSVICDCPLHRGTLVEQISGYLCNGKPVIVLVDVYGYHVGVGRVGTNLNFNLHDLSDPVSRPTALAMIVEARES